MEKANILRIILLACIFYTLPFARSSSIAQLNLFIWSIMAIFPIPIILHICHIIGAIQIILGWYIFPKKLCLLYIKLLLVIWILLIIRGDCIVNEISFYKIGFKDTEALTGIPILCYLAFMRL